MHNTGRSARAILAVWLLLMAVPAGASARVVTAAPPTMVIRLDPIAPDGSNGWYVTAPEAWLETDQDATAHWAWDAGPEQTADLLALVPSFVGDAGEGTSELWAYAENLEGRGATASVTIRTDSVPPEVPGGLTGSPGPGQVRLEWSVPAEAGSGISYYNVYRNVTGLPFELSDLLGSSLTTGYADSALPPAPRFYYAVSAVDVAGWESLLTAAVSVTPDLIPPTAPGDVQAWKNASNWARVSWASSIDTGTGIAQYVVRRSLDGGEMTSIATLTAAARYHDDTDRQVPLAGTVTYEVVAMDRAGWSSAPGGPVGMGVDTAAPVQAASVALAPVYSGTYSAAQFDLSWAAPTDAGSGVLRTEVLHGAVPGVPSAALEAPSSPVRLTADDATALWYAQIRAEDRAGNASELTSPVGARNVAADRLAGSDRIRTAIAVSESGFVSADTVVVASSRSYADALSASALAGAVRGPILLVGPGAVPAHTLAEISRLGASDAYVVGGTGAVSGETAGSLADALEGVVTRVWGTTRYDTAAAVADELVARAGGAAPPRVHVVSGTGFADALSVSPAAYAEAAPVLFANRDSVPDATIAAVRRTGATRVLVTGGELAVTAAAEIALPGVQRVAGADRYATCRLFAEWAESEGLLSRTAPVIATGVSYPDGLAAGPLAGARGSVLVLVSPGSVRSMGAWLADARSTMLRQTTVGGPAAVGEATRRTVWGACSVP